MTVIWKFQLPPDLAPGLHSVAMPEDSVILSIQLQRNDPMAEGERITIWAEVDPTQKKKVNRKLFAAWTGTAAHDSLPKNRVYLATVQDIGGIVWHFYEVP